MKGSLQSRTANSRISTVNWAAQTVEYRPPAAKTN